MIYKWMGGNLENECEKNGKEGISQNEKEVEMS